MRQNRQLIVIASAIVAFAAAAITGFGGWPAVAAIGLVAVAVVDSACRSIDRSSTEQSRGNFTIASEPIVEPLRPAVPSDQAA